MRTNLNVLRKTRRRPRVGDIFALRPEGRGFFFGRVVRTDARAFVEPVSILLYIYSFESDRMEIPDQLDFRSLLIAPVMTNAIPWSEGLFEHLENRPLKESDVLPQHCFRDLLGNYVNEYREALPGPFPPVGVFALQSLYTIDDRVSKALGIEPVPD